MNIERQHLLKRLLSVQPGLTPGKGTVQSNCVVFKNGRLYTLNREIACSIESGLDKSMTGAIEAKPLIDLLKKMTERDVNIDIEPGSLIIEGYSRGARMTMQAEVLMPLAAVELPKDWMPLSADFTAAADLTFRCTVKESKDFAKTCVHFHPDWMEACDNNKMARWTLSTFVNDSVLVRGTTVKAVIPLGMTKGAETTNWLHFRNPFGLRVSLRKWPVQSYPDHSAFLSMQGEKITFPKGLADAADRAGVMLDEIDGSVKVSISGDKARVEAAGMTGEWWEEKGIEYDGPDMAFLIPPKLIAELVEKQTTCEVSPVCLRVANESYTYVTSLEVSDG